MSKPKYKSPPKKIKPTKNAASMRAKTTKDVLKKTNKPKRSGRRGKY